MAATLKSPGYRSAADRVRELTRARLGLGPADVIAVAEASPALPGFPPVITVVQFWTAEGRRHHFTVFRPMGEVTTGHLPFAWQKDALAVADDFECACCG